MLARGRGSFAPIMVGSAAAHSMTGAGSSTML